MRRVALALGLVALLGVGVYLASEDPPPPAPPPVVLPDVNGYYALTIGHGEGAEQYSIGVKAVPPGHAEFELLGVSEPCEGKLSADGRCSARILIAGDAETETPAEVWTLEGQFVPVGEVYSLEGDFKVEVEGKRSAVVRRFGSYYEGALEELE